MTHEQEKPLYYDGSGTIQWPKQIPASKDTIIKPVGVNIEHINIPYFPYS